MMAIYTRTGDKGKTRIIGGHTFDKFHPRIETYGTIDEVNSFVGYLISQMDVATCDDLIQDGIEIQQVLFDCGNDLASINAERPYKVEADQVTWLEERIDALDKEVEPISKFILPGGNGTASLAHICRTTSRRAERQIVQLYSESEPTNENEAVLKYLNRVSDYFFILARVLNARANVEDIQYRNSKPVFTDGIRAEKLAKLKNKKASL